MQSFTGMPSFTERQGDLYKEQINPFMSEFKEGLSGSTPSYMTTTNEDMTGQSGGQASFQDLLGQMGLGLGFGGVEPQVQAQRAEPQVQVSYQGEEMGLGLGSLGGQQQNKKYQSDQVILDDRLDRDSYEQNQLSNTLGTQGSGIASVAPEGSYQAEFLRLKAENPNDPRYAGEVPDYVSPEQQELSAVNPNDPRYNSGIMSQAPSSMTDPSVMDLMRSPMDRGPMNQSPSQQEQSPFGGSFSNYLTGGYGGGNMGGFGGGTSGFGAMGTGMSAGGGIMSMANPMQEQMSMMPQQMMNQGGYAPKSAPSSGQSLYGSTTSTNNQQSIYGQQQVNSPFAGASRGYYA